MLAAIPRSDWAATVSLTLSPPTLALSWAGVPSAITRPWSITAIRSARLSASSRCCVVSRTVVPSAASPRTASQVTIRLGRSSPVVGSSRKRIGGLGDDIVASHHGPSAVRSQQRGQHADRRRLSCPVGSEHAENRAARDLEVDARKRLGMAEGLLEPGYLDCLGYAHPKTSSTVYD